MPVTGSSLALSCSMVHVGDMRRSAESNRGDDGLSPGTMIKTEISAAVWNDILQSDAVNN